MQISPRALSRLVATTAEHAPTAFDESWLRTTWSGAHGRLGLVAKPTGVSSTISLLDDGISGSARLVGDIDRPSGRHVGDFTRMVTLQPNGRLSVYHAFLDLNRRVQKSGFASSFNARAFERYAAAGVDDVTLTASLDAGGYVWAKAGFELLGRGSDDTARALYQAEKLRSMVNYAHDNGKLSATQYAQLAPRLLGETNALRPDTIISVQELASMPIGEQVLLGQTWSGIKQLKLAGLWFDRTGRSGVRDAVESVAYLRDTAERPRELTEAANSIRRALPDLLDARSIVKDLESRTADDAIRLVAGNDSSTTMDLVSGAATADLHFSAVDAALERPIGTFHYSVNADPHGMVATNLDTTNVTDHEAVYAVAGELHDVLKQIGAR